MNSSEQVDQLATALAKVQSEAQAIPKDASNPFFKSKYADLATVVEKASPIVSRHGLAVAQTLGFDGTYDTLTTLLLHSSGQWIGDTARLHLTKDDSQGHGSATTYLRRYSYMAILGLVTDEDDDGNAASAQPARTEQTTRRPPPRRPEPKPERTMNAAEAEAAILQQFSDEPFD